ncbi:MAG: O-antigen ligase family protein [Oscillospiraceae bacterium]|nr:O-antigen ligase family protein [Oscillospiraceae bacterium]
MNNAGIISKIKSRLSANPQPAVYALFALQPLLNILSYWTARTGGGNTLTLLLRFGVLAVVALAGFLLSGRKRRWLAAGAACALFWLCHMAVCASVGYEDWISDLTNFVRVLQMPLFTGCFLVFLRWKPELLRTMERALLLNFWLISACVLLSVVTGTSAITYTNSQCGVMGWAANSNAQSAILSALTPVAVLYACRRNSLPRLILTVAAGFLQLYFFGTRLAFGAILVTVAGASLAMILTKKFTIPKAAILLAGVILCVATVRLSPMYLNQYTYNSEMDLKQGWEAGIYEKAKQEAEEEFSSDSEADSARKDADHKALRYIYEFYAPKICARFGTERVMEAYDYTQDVRTITAARPRKILFCKLLMEEYPFAARLFGTELSRMTYDGEIFDVENDFPGIFFLYGAMGLAAMVGFLLYFVWRILRCLIRDFRRYFTMKAAAAGMAFSLLLAYCVFTAGVLRRPEASFYLSAVLALIWHLSSRDYVDEGAEQ